MAEEKKLWDVDSMLWIPPEVTVCPICKSKLVITEFPAMQQCDDGLWKATEISLECEKQPDIDSDNWDDWFDGHYSMPYVDWLPVEQTVLAWLEQNYRFDGEIEN